MKRTFKVVVGLVVALWLGARLVALPRVMRHCDDIGPIIGFIKAKDLSWTQRMQTMQIWTYAPAQFVLTDLLVRRASSPEMAVFLGRLPSFLFWLMGVGIFVGLLSKLDREEPGLWPYPLRLLLVAWALLSWRGIIESSQGYNYAAAFFGVSLLLRATIPASTRARLLGAGPLGIFLAVLVLGFLVSLSYQIIFFAAALGLAILILEIQSSGRGRIPRLAWIGLGLAAWVQLFYKVHLGRFAAYRGHPPWADYSSSHNFLIHAAQVLWGWFRLAENALSMVPWGWQTFTLTFFALALAALGYWRPKIRGQLEGRWPLALALGIGLVWTWGAWTWHFPCGATRHTFLLQLPVLLVIGAGLGRLGLPQKAWLAATACLVLASAWTLPQFIAGIEDRVDLHEIETFLEAHPRAMTINAPLSYTQDDLLLLVTHPDWKDRLSAVGIGDPAASDEVLLLSHRGPLLEETNVSLQKAGYKTRALHALEPIGSTELAGNMNGGNGYFLFLAER